MARFASVFMLALSLVCLGCGDGTPSSKLNRNAVSGKVTLDSKPLPHGSIVFHPLSPSGESTVSGTTIKEGAFTLEEANGLPVGKYKVVITATSAEGTQAADPQAAMDAAAKPAEESALIPAKYNSNTELTCDIVNGPNDQLTFDLKSGS